MKRSKQGSAFSDGSREPAAETPAGPPRKGDKTSNLWGPLVAVVLVDIVSRLAAPAALLALAHGYLDISIVVAATVSLAAVVRGLLTGKAVELTTCSIWHEITAATRSFPITLLRARPVTHGLTALLEATKATISFRAVEKPLLVSNSLGLAVVIGLIVWRLGSALLVLGAISFGLAAVLVILGRKQLIKAQTGAWLGFKEASRAFEVLLDAPEELRAHGCEPEFTRALLSTVKKMARHDRKVSVYSSLVGLFPLGIALLVAIVPLRAGIEWLSANSLARRFAEIGVLGGTALMLGLGLIRGIEAASRSGPLRHTLREYLERARRDQRSDLTATARAIELEQTEIVFDDVCIQYSGMTDCTPHRVQFRWKPGRGLAVTGANGVGKSSLALALLGLLKPTRGTVRFGTVRATELDDEVRQQIAYLPQYPFVAPGATVGWHLRLLTDRQLSDEHLLATLERLDLRQVLENHARSANSAPLDVLVGKLSGGERRRMQLARALLTNPSLIVLDEPEANLDHANRQRLRDLIAELAQTRRVVVVAHDSSVVPEKFERLACVRQPCSDVGTKAEM